MKEFLLYVVVFVGGGALAALLSFAFPPLTPLFIIAMIFVSRAIWKNGIKHKK